MTMPPMTERNVLGTRLQPCGSEPLTGFYRDGCCRTGAEDVGSHTICAVVSGEFLDYQQSIGNDLSTPVGAYGFPGLKPGDRWCVCAGRWREALEAGMAPPVVLAATHEETLAVVPLDDLKRHAIDLN